MGVIWRFLKYNNLHINYCPLAKYSARGIIVCFGRVLLLLSRNRAFASRPFPYTFAKTYTLCITITIFCTFTIGNYMPLALHGLHKLMTCWPGGMSFVVSLPFGSFKFKLQFSIKRSKIWL